MHYSVAFASLCRLETPPSSSANGSTLELTGGADLATGLKGLGKEHMLLRYAKRKWIIGGAEQLSFDGLGRSGVGVDAGVESFPSWGFPGWPVRSLRGRHPERVSHLLSLGLYAGLAKTRDLNNRRWQDQKSFNKWDGAR